jgi:hypothetical protein
LLLKSRSRVVAGCLRPISNSPVSNEKRIG